MLSKLFSFAKVVLKLTYVKGAAGLWRVVRLPWAAHSKVRQSE